MMSTRSANKLLALLLVTTLTASSSFARLTISRESKTVIPADSGVKPKPYSVQPSREALKWADKELGRMSLEQKVGQLVSVEINAGFLNR